MIHKRWNPTRFYTIQNCGEVLLLPSQQSIIVEEEPGINIPHKTIERLPTSCKFFRDAAYTGYIIGICSNVGFPRQRNGGMARSCNVLLAPETRVLSMVVFINILVRFPNVFSLLECSLIVACIKFGGPTLCSPATKCSDEDK